MYNVGVRPDQKCIACKSPPSLLIFWLLYAALPHPPLRARFPKKCKKKKLLSNNNNLAKTSLKIEQNKTPIIIPYLVLPDCKRPRNL